MWSSQIQLKGRVGHHNVQVTLHGCYLVVRLLLKLSITSIYMVVPENNDCRLSFVNL